MPPRHPPEPWASFLAGLDAAISEPTALHCLGGFAIATLYGLPRPTEDIDALEVKPQTDLNRLLEVGGKGSELHRKHGVYLDYVTALPAYPENYDDRLVPLFENSFRELSLFALDAYDIALCKIMRNSQRDRDDVRFLARAASFDLAVLRERYHAELRIYLGNPEREDVTLEMWCEMIGEDRSPEG